MMIEITKQDLIESSNKQVIALLMGFFMGAATIALPIVTTYPEKNTCVMEQDNE